MKFKESKNHLFNLCRAKNFLKLYLKKYVKLDFSKVGCLKRISDGWMFKKMISDPLKRDEASNDYA